MKDSFRIFTPTILFNYSSIRFVLEKKKESLRIIASEKEEKRKRDISNFLQMAF